MSFFRRTASLGLACLIALNVSHARVAFAQDAKQDPPKEQKVVDAVDYKKLKELLPESVGEVKRSNAEGTKQSMGEMKISQATGTYSVDGKDAHANITIIDYGAMPGTAAGIAGWSKMEIDNDSDTEYSKTVEVNGSYGLETYNKKDKNGSLMLYVADRFIVSIEVNGMPSETLKQTAEAMKLKDLAAMAK